MRNHSKGLFISEKDEQKLFKKYMDIQWPEVLWNFDMGGAMLGSYAYAMEMHRQGNRKGWPDIFVAEAKGEYHGLFIELKKTGTKLYTKKGEPIKGSKDRIATQLAVLSHLEKKGYKAIMAFGFDEARKVLEDYMRLGN